MIMADATDMKLVKMLSRNSNLTNARLAKALGLTEGSIRNRKRKLEKERIIVGYSARARYQLLDEVQMLTGLDIMPEKFNTVLSKLAKVDEISELYATSGDHTAIFNAIVPSQRVSSFISSMEHIDGIRKVYPSLVQEVLK